MQTIVLDVTWYFFQLLTVGTRKTCLVDLCRTMVAVRVVCLEPPSPFLTACTKDIVLSSISQMKGLYSWIIVLKYQRDKFLCHMPT